MQKKWYRAAQEVYSDLKSCVGVDLSEDMLNIAERLQGSFILFLLIISNQFEVSGVVDIIHSINDYLLTIIYRHYIAECKYWIQALPYCGSQCN